MKTYDSIGIGIPEILLPAAGSDFTRWAVVACDQYTSQPEYWEQVKKSVSGAPSTLNLIYPEVYLNEANPERRIADIHNHMRDYLAKNILESHNGLVYLEREAAGRIRKGMLLCLDLERYDYSKGSTSLVRATEGTIVERLPPRMRIREGAPLELPHIMVLIDDPADTVIGSLTAAKDTMKQLYDFPLMMKSGHLKGWLANDAKLEKIVATALEKLADPAAFSAKYGLPAGAPVLLFAMGDGNHSLATAKAIWEKTKAEAADKAAVMNSLTRYALVEIVNLHDNALQFEPIHRVLFEIAAGRDLLGEMANFFSGHCRLHTVGTADEMKRRVDAQSGPGQLIGYIAAGAIGVIEIDKPVSNLPVGSLQAFLDPFVKGGGAREIDYVHGTETVINLGIRKGNAGLYLPAMNKNDLFKTVILDGALPRKTFSMGEAEEKRFYVECRRIG